MHGSYCYRYYRREDNAELAKLIREVLNPVVAEDYCKWKYTENPDGDAMSSMVAHNGNIVGQIGMIPLKYSMKNEQVTGVQEVDFILDENHRNLGILFNLSKRRQETCQQNDISFCYGFTTPETSVIAQKGSHFARIDPIPRLVKIIDLYPVLHHRFGPKAWLNTVSKVGNRMIRFWYKKKIRTDPDSRLVVLSEFDDRFDVFWDQIKNDYGIMKTRNSRYLNWRYCKIPYSACKIICLEKKSSREILGFSVLGSKYKHVPIGYILEFITQRNSDNRIEKTLLAKIIDEFYKDGVSQIVCWMFSHVHSYGQFKKQGFMTRRIEGRDFVVEITGDLHRKNLSQFITNKRNWYISMGDSDFYF